MSNKIRIFFCICCISVSAHAVNIEPQQIDSLEAQAKYFFDYEQYPDAIQTYLTLLKGGYLQADMLYRIAFMYEQLHQYPESIYYLRKLQWQLGGPHLNAKIEQLMDKGSRERLSAGESWGAYRLWIQHNMTLLISGCIAAAVIALLSLLLPFKKWSLGIGLFAAALTLFIGGVWIEHTYNHPTKAVIMQKSAYYDLPGYAASYRTLPISPGATVSVLQEQDIWCQISMGQFQTWVPKFVINEI